MKTLVSTFLKKKRWSRQTCRWKREIIIMCDLEPLTHLLTKPHAWWFCFRLTKIVNRLINEKVVIHKSVIIHLHLLCRLKNKDFYFNEIILKYELVFW